MTHPTFTARFLRDGSTALQCRQSGARYIVAGLSGGYTTTLRNHSRDEFGAYRNGQLIFTGPRAAAINAVESDARWSLHNPH